MDAVGVIEMPQIIRYLGLLIFASAEFHFLTQ
jgi:hypothetical protein